MLDGDDAVSVISEIVWLVLGSVYSLCSECIVSPLLYFVSRLWCLPCAIPGAICSLIGGSLTTIVNVVQDSLLVVSGPFGPAIGTVSALIWALGNTILGFIKGCVTGAILTLPCCGIFGIVPLVEGCVYAFPRALQAVEVAPQLISLIGQVAEIGIGGITVLVGGGLAAVFGGGLLATVCGGGLLATILGGCTTVLGGIITILFGGIAGIPVIGGTLAAVCGGIATIPVAIGGLLTSLITAISGIPLIGGPLAAIIGAIGSLGLGLPSAVCCGVPATLLGGGGIASIPMVIGTALAPFIMAISGIPLIGGPLAAICGPIAAICGCVI